MQENPVRSHRLVDAPVPVPTSRDGLRFTDLASLMKASPSSVDLAGDYRGRIVSLVALQRLPGMLRSPITSIIAILTRPVWQGKRFDGNIGTNLWLRNRRPRTFGDFTISTAEQGPHRILNYDRHSNPRPLRRVTGKVAALGPGVYIAAMYLTIAGRKITLMYFTLDK